jgi:hypothetical protein
MDGAQGQRPWALGTLFASAVGGSATVVDGTDEAGPSGGSWEDLDAKPSTIWRWSIAVLPILLLVSMGGSPAPENDNQSWQRRDGGACDEIHKSECLGAEQCPQGRVQDAGDLEDG